MAIYDLVFIGPNAKIGKNCKIQMFAFIPDNVIIKDHVFIGPHVCFTNDRYPPSNGAWKDELPTVVCEYASIGANATVLPGVTIGKHAIIGAGSVVTRDVPPGKSGSEILRNIKEKIPVTGANAMNDQYSHTSNIVKLLKHLGSLKTIQEGRTPAPILLHTMPTHRCQLSCAHCCFKNRDDFQLDIDPFVYMLGVTQFWMLGTRAMELTGGGEPTLYPHLGRCLEYFLTLKMKIGLITNGLALDRISYLVGDLAWIRISLNSLDYRPPTALRTAMNLLLAKGTHFSFCYIWNKNSPKNFEAVADFAKTYKAPCRISPDCIQPLNDIACEIEEIRALLKEYDNEYLFLSDFNTTLTRRNDACYIHMIKPALYTDGFVYPCPSAELAVENNKKINDNFAICHASEVYAHYTSPNFKPRLFHSCSYCKYSLQQDFLEDLTTETDCNEFA